MPKVNWDDAPEWANYVAMDSDGSWWWYRDVPNLGINTWRSLELSEIIWGNANWENSLQERPNA